MTQFRVRHDSVQGVAWLCSACGVAQLGYGVNQHRVQSGSDEGCDVAQLRMGHGSVRVRPSSVWVRHGSTGCSVEKQGAAWKRRVQRR
jgi:hypothetical protein